MNKRKKILLSSLTIALTPSIVVSCFNNSSEQNKKSLDSIKKELEDLLSTKENVLNLYSDNKYRKIYKDLEKAYLKLEIDIDNIDASLESLEKAKKEISISLEKAKKEKNEIDKNSTLDTELVISRNELKAIIDNRDSIFSNYQDNKYKSILDLLTIKFNEALNVFNNLNSTKTDLDNAKSSLLAAIDQAKKEKNEIDNNSASIPLNKSIKISNWNVCNLGGLSDFNRDVKLKAITSLINYLDIDIQGLIEVELGSLDSIQEMVRVLNIMNPQAKWNYIFSDPSDGINKIIPSDSNVHEACVILYKESKVNPKNFESLNKPFVSFDNSSFKNVFNAPDNVGYVRPPFGVYFETVGQIRNDFTLVIDHFDQPGNHQYDGGTAKKTPSGNKIKSQGRQESNEAWNLKLLMNFYDDLDKENDELIFMADTNIRKGNETALFEPILNNGYQSILNESLALTSLGTSWNYSESYDKIFYKGDLTFSTERDGYYPLYNIIEDNVIKDFDANEVWINYVKSFGKNYSNDASYIRSAIADHCSVFFTLNLDKNDLD
ncbi:MnuA family membrane nuclease [Mycoplasma sp. Mirounga ES2805-ORL]|uniref:MnuA family membrane nuclease n=1 Tax=Mycoplasma sp. Mirounga ES2805-ORL TaxID=754514 RepID=UPI00197C5514|nr:hypothetical protein [Mycoplasma sp. Mirounga ES2805-ORL]QSF13714.1 hypothetical protein JXZ90_00210 [Mycoplasma sp. Mirounga ES2805-ORL]